ncbi:DUF202 domain-containing protein [Laspinema sp. A4]|uniref:YidH family protein n=1 Tax=Laspinema sp. D2d TaxID=2953686 RepID=UPI0021BA9094|nr:DUF202 domain-containing protein [Laspinema sp. D2d]MCT7984575.1 DUF202 domain-containing protein [Laspinema sp. D2d]
MTQDKIDRQREHQANERTFLAWLRTSIGMIGFGFAIARFGLFLRELQASVTGEPDTGTAIAINSQTLGVVLVIMGIIFIPLSVWRYNQVFQQIEFSAYRPSRWMVWLTAATVMIVGVLTIPFVLFRHSTREPIPPLEPQSWKNVMGDRDRQ